MNGRTRTILVAHPSPDLYGSDRQLLETALPASGPLVPELEALGARVAVVPFTVLRKSLLSPRSLAGLAARAVGEIARLRSLIRADGADLLLVNTVTLPWWAPAGRAAGVPVLAHVHEAEDTQNLLVRAGLNAPLLAASRVVVNSRAARAALVRRARRPSRRRCASAPRTPPSASPWWAGSPRARGSTSPWMRWGTCAPTG